jgi:hypothetical protein
MSLQPSLSRRNRTLPRFEALESRQVLSATVQQVGGVLTVTGSDRPDLIQLNDNGSTVRVFDGITLKGTFAGVNLIDVNTKAGNDSVRYEVQGDIPLFPFGNRSVAVRRNLRVDLGAGNDFFETEVVRTLRPPQNVTTQSSLGLNSNLNVVVLGQSGFDNALFRANTIDAGAKLNFRFDGGLGADGYNVIYGLPVAAQQANTVVKLTFNGNGGDDAAFVKVTGDLPSNAQTIIDLEGGTGNDSLFVRYENGIEDGFISLLVNGGDGADRVIADFEMRAGSNLGEVNAHVNGDAGNDDLTLVGHKQIPTNATQFNGFINGGTGTDTAHFTSTVAVGAVENLFPVP